MKLKINRGLVPIKAHFFFFFAALGPILPQLNVFGRQLGIPPDVMGMVTAVLPLLWAVAKPLFGYIVDFWPNHRKLIFMLLITLMTGSYCCLWFIPMPEHQITEPALLQSIYHLNNTVYVNQYDKISEDFLEKYTCHWSCTKETNSNSFDVYLSNNTYINTLFVDATVNSTACSFLHMDFDEVREGEVTCSPKKDCDLLCYEFILENVKLNTTNIDLANNGTYSKETLILNKTDGISSISEQKSASKPVVLYMTGPFWSFVVLMSVGTVAFNVANCIGDAVCFDVLGPEQGSRYGSQRAWGTAGYGITALAGGWLVELVSGSGRNFAPAFIVALVATAMDLFSCTALTLPPLSSPQDSGAALRAVLRMPRVLVFIMFACIAGVFDSFIIYYMFWFLEEMAEQTGHTDRIKLIEGIVVAGQSFFGEILFFALSGRIIKRLGYGVTFTFCLFCYGVRMALISMIHNPWHLVFIESVMQGPTYALCYAAIVGYAATVAPPGYSATVQGVVAGADDGLGFALGSLIGGQVYRLLGGRGSFRVLAVAAVAAAIAHAVSYAILNRPAKEIPEQPAEAEAQKMLPVSIDSGAIYQSTVEPVSDSAKR